MTSTSIYNWEKNFCSPSTYSQGQLAKAFNISIEKFEEIFFTFGNVPPGAKLEKPNYITLQNLPFIGRDEDIQKILAKLQDERFFAITGTIGVGKGELAYQAVDVARRKGGFDDKAVRFINIADETSTEGAVKKIKYAIEELQRLNLLETRILLVLDNCEYVKHLKHFTEELYQLLKQHRQLTILATSRVKMTNLDYPIKPLETNDAVQLFLAAAKNFTPTGDDPKVAELCLLLDRLPLALLLAAGLLNYDPFNEVYIWAKENSILNAQISFPEDKRHETTLQVLVERHYHKLGEDEPEEKITAAKQQLQALFRRLAIFVAPCSMKAVKEVCIIQNDLPEQKDELQNLLRSLVNSYLITSEDGWIAIINTILRLFAMLELKKNKEEFSEVRRKFIEYYRSLVNCYIGQQSHNEALDITEYLESSHEKFENMFHAYKLNGSKVFPLIESMVKNILGKEYECIPDQLIKYISENVSDLSKVPGETNNHYAKWCHAVEQVSKQEQELITLYPSLALWQKFWRKVKKCDMYNLTELYKTYGLYK